MTRRARVELVPTHYRPGWMALVWATIAYREYVFGVFFARSREMAEADAEQYRVAILAGGVLP